MAKIHSTVLVLLCLLTTACAAGPTVPSPTRAPLALTGQSQAVLVEPPLARLYPGPIVGAWESGLSIAFWGPEDRMWRQLVPALHQSLAALVWMQGESDCDGLSTAVPDYAVRFPATMARIRTEANNPALPVLIVSVSPLESCAGVRAVQAAWSAADAHAALINADDVPRRDWPRDLHFTEAGAQMVAQRIVAAVP